MDGHGTDAYIYLKVRTEFGAVCEKMLVCRVAQLFFFILPSFADIFLFQYIRDLLKIDIVY